MGDCRRRMARRLWRWLTTAPNGNDASTWMAEARYPLYTIMVSDSWGFPK
jgi:hypothetical protein